MTINNTDIPRTIDTAEGAADQAASPAANDDELTKLRAENEKLRRSLRDDEARRGLIAELTSEGARSPELLYEAARRSLEFSPEGALMNAAAAIRDLRQRFPEQFEQHAPPPPIDAGRGRTPALGITRAALARMTPAEITRLDWNEVKAALKQ